MSQHRLQLFSFGGGRQTVGMVALMKLGRLPLPDAACMVDTNREKGTTFAYLDAYIRPAFAELGVPFTLIDRAKYATVDLWSTKDEDFLPPAHTNITGQSGRLPEFCSVEWKRRTVMRWSREQDGWFDRGVDCWLGLSWDEKHRRGIRPREKWYQPSYPLCDRRWGLSVCLDAAHAIGWPEPPRSSCWMCPNMEDHEWASLPADELEMACKVEESVRSRDPNLFFHRSLIPLRQVAFKPDSRPGLFSGGCSSGMCY